MTILSLISKYFQIFDFGSKKMSGKNEMWLFGGGCSTGGKFLPFQECFFFLLFCG